jgi:hypothetical protein
MDSLRSELIETQKVRTDLIKWKLILVSVLAATGLGFTEIKSVPYAEVVLCCIPFVCAYVDLQCASLSLRISGISFYFQKF